jgi:hypothetical protein
MQPVPPELDAAAGVVIDLRASAQVWAEDDAEDRPLHAPVVVVKTRPWHPPSTTRRLTLIARVAVGVAVSLAVALSVVLRTAQTPSSAATQSPPPPPAPPPPAPPPPSATTPPPHPLDVRTPSASIRRPERVTVDVGLRRLPVLGEAARWRREDEHGILFNMRNGAVRGGFDAACANVLVPIPSALDAAYHVVEIEPYLTLHPASNESIVHHMDLFLCDASTRHVDDRGCMTESAYLGDGVHGPCYVLMWAYDKGAMRPHRLPPDAGVRVGAGTRFAVFHLQVHYQVPPGSASAMQLLRQGFQDTSGVRVTLEPRQRAVDAWSFSFMDVNMNIGVGATGLEYASHLPSTAVKTMLGHDIASAGGEIALRQIHAHAHSHATRVSLHRERHGHWEKLFELRPYCGYGECQHFHELPAGTQLQIEDALEFRCEYVNSESIALTYGLSAKMEMCGAIIVYTPHDSRAAARPTWYGTTTGGTQLDQATGRSYHPGMQITQQVGASGAGGHML